MFASTVAGLDYGGGIADELLALRRITVRDPSSSGPAGPTPGVTEFKLSFAAPESPGRHRLRAYCVSDCYLGLDAMCQLEVMVEP